MLSRIFVNDRMTIFVEENDIIKSKIHLIRGEQVMLDSDLAELYGVETRRLNEQVRRNLNRFPEDFMFQLTTKEYANLMSQNATSSWGGRRKMPMVFTSLGISMLSSVLTSDVAIQANIRIVRAFVTMRKQISELSAQQIQIERLEMKVDRLNDYVESILHDQNEINEETALQIELINESIAQLNALQETDKARHKIGFITNYESTPQSKTDK